MNYAQESLSIITERPRVPNQPPITDWNKIAIVGEAPGQDEENYNQPFVGVSGRFLNLLLANANISRKSCFVGNVCQVRPAGNNFNRHNWDGEEVQDGIAKLCQAINKFDPNVIVLLGNVPLHLFLEGNKSPLKKSSIYIFPNKITSWRGSMFLSNKNLPLHRQYKCLPSLHPAGVLRQYEGYPLLLFDLNRAAQESRSSELHLPERRLSVDYSASELCHLLDAWPSGQLCSLDIEGRLPYTKVNPRYLKKMKVAMRAKHHWSCVALSGDPTKGFTITWHHLSESDHVRVLRSFIRLMERTDVPKCLQNSLYDNFVLSWGYGILIRNVTEDTMLKGWEVYSELPKALSVQASIWTREPLWKDDSMYNSSGKGLYVGCAKDAAVTLEICKAQDNALDLASREHYRMNVSMLNPALYMELRGMRYDADGAKKFDHHVQRAQALLGDQLEQIAGMELRGGKGSLSSTKLSNYMYLRGNYPKQYKKEHGRKTSKLTTDVKALLTLKRNAPDDPFLSKILRHRYYEKLHSTLQVETDADGRVRGAYNVVGTETGRLSVRQSPTGSGTALQTITKRLRRFYCADEGYEFFQNDLEGADGWTVAARCAALGDDTMLEDYQARMKPAKIIALLYHFGQVINKLSRSDLKWLHDNIFPLVSAEHGDWLYMGSKRVQHGTNYLMGIPTMCMQILMDSYKYAGMTVYVPQADARTLQNLYLSRYPGVQLWQRQSEALLVSKGKLLGATGHTRVFFGRRHGGSQAILDTVKEYLADEPQQNTTYATNLATLRLWNDPENRIVRKSDYRIWNVTGECFYWAGPKYAYDRLGPGGLIIEPLHSVHDALCGQWPTFLRDWARPRVRSYFDNPISVADINLTIPADGSYGPSWGQQESKI